ncbi:MAG: hypothetical protein R3C11_08765 [Planctomycetaceae bacterium]
MGLLDASLRENPHDVLDRMEQLLKPYGVASVTPLEDQSSHFFLSSEIENLKTTVILHSPVFF